MTKINISIKEDLHEVKIADRKKKILNIISKWLIEHNSNKRQEFRSEFLSSKNDKYFNELKDLIGDFKDINKISILDFLAEVIVFDNSKYPILNQLHKDFEKLKRGFYENLKGGIKEK